jgi:hypothetical protein
MDLDCILCEDEVTELGIAFKHDTHALCDRCQKDLTKICCCTKAFNTEPNAISVLCPCDQKYQYYPTNNTQILKLFTKLKNSDAYYMIESCRGCRLTTEQIQSELSAAISANTEACIYKRTDQGGLSMMAYVSDALDSEFIDEMKNRGIDIGTCVDL